jgi:hypothetical protein
VRFEACDHGLVNLSLTPFGIEEIENPTSEVEWHSWPGAGAFREMHPREE